MTSFNTGLTAETQRIVIGKYNTGTPVVTTNCSGDTGGILINNVSGITLQDIDLEEGASSVDELATLAVTMARSPLMGQAYAQYFGGLRAAGLNGPFENFTDMYPISGTTGFRGFNWRLLEDSQQTTSPKYQAALDWIRRNPCWWAGCRH